MKIVLAMLYLVCMSGTLVLDPIRTIETKRTDREDSSFSHIVVEVAVLVCNYKLSFHINLLWSSMNTSYMVEHAFILTSI